MKVKILAGFLVITCLFSLTGCNNLSLIKVSKDIEDKEKENDSGEEILPDIKASYGVAKLNDNLINNQEKYNNEGLIYYEIYNNNSNLLNKVKEYGIEFEDPFKNVFDEEYFNKYILIAIYPGVTSSNSKYKVVDINNVKKEEDIWLVKITKETSTRYTEVDINPVIFVSIKRKLYEVINVFDINLI